ncbi:DUF6318 family protein [Rothia aeria]|uniref:DUF6318 family protein n=1 Tax=Rothia aeria TaxID=172042 RepID=UPI0028ECFC4F|nr:DUF6318 family protein [Rothia aeria]
MSASVSRRFLFTGAVGGASILFLSACSSGASVVAAERTDYSGEVSFDSFRREGEYTAPTRTEPAKNAPVPTLPHNVNEHTVAGLYSTIGFIAASVTYAYQTGDTGRNLLDGEYHKRLDTDSQSSSDSSDSSDYKIWSEAPDIRFTLKDPMPTREGDTYSWPAIMTAKLGSFLVSAGRAREIPAERREQKYEGTIKARYSDGVWRLKLEELLSDDTNNSRSSGGSKTI